jgi:glutamate-1-semialdehyde 2,1-aminomutase
MTADAPAPKRRCVAIVQARMASTRLPGKTLAPLGDTTVLGSVLRRLGSARRVDAVVVATSTAPADDAVAQFAASAGIAVFRGDESDVLGRYRDAAREVGAEVVVRITADCPFVDPAIVDACVGLLDERRADYASNVMQRTFPDGLDVEVFTASTLERTAAEAEEPRFREHVTPYMRTGHYPKLPDGGFRVAHLVHASSFAHLRWTVDTREDLDFCREVLKRLPGDFAWLDLVALLTREPPLMSWNRGTGNRRGALAVERANGSGQRPNDRYAASNRFFDRAIKTIPLASQTFSKSHQQMVLGASPLFAARGRGAELVDIDGNSYVDCIMGLLSVVLGYRDPDVDAAIVGQIEKGISFSLASTLEAELAETLGRLIPCAKMVRFGKNGSDATTAAIRLARAATGRAKVAVAGYHGWHDWYIGTTTRRIGVPAEVQALSSVFTFNDADSLKHILEKDPDGFAAVILEPDGAAQPAPGFLEAVRALTSRYGVVLVFDEIVSGFRSNIGGAQAEYGVVPDLAAFGKAMGNGMPISAIVGQGELMERMNDIFFSATFGGEALSLAAAIATIRKLERENAIDRLKALGTRLSAAANETIRRRGFGDLLEFGGADWWPRLKIGRTPVETNLFKSLLRQELYASGLLLGASLNLSLAHEAPGVGERIVASLDSALANLRIHLDSADPASALRGKVMQPTFSVR